MTEEEITALLDEAEAILERGGSLPETSFWKAVGAVKRCPDLAPRLGDRIARIDRRAFEDWARLVLPLPVGTALATGGTLLGLAGVAAGYFTAAPLNWIVFGAGVAALLGATHGLAHLVVGNLVGIRFTHWFMASVLRPQPGVKVGITPPLHASGALVGKAIPFLLIPAAIAADLPGWFSWALGGLGVAQVATDVLWSTKSSDWKRFRREMAYRDSSGQD